MTEQAIDPRRNAAIALSVGIVAAVLFVVLTAIVMSQQTAVLDRETILSLRSGGTPLLTTIFLAVTFTSGKLAIPALILFAAILCWQGRRRAAAYYVAACVSAELLNAVLKHAVNRVRPHGVSPLLTAAGGYSFPSADAMLAVVIFGLGTLLLVWSIRSPLLRLAAIGVSALFVIAAAMARVYLGAHWPTDVIGGVLAGTACAAFWLRALWQSPVMPASTTPPAEEIPGASR